MQVKLCEPFAAVLLVTLNRIDCTPLLYISKRGSMIECMEIILENRFESSQGVHQLCLWRIDSTKTTRFLWDVKGLIQLAPFLCTKLCCIVIKSHEFSD